MKTKIEKLKELEVKFKLFQEDLAFSAAQLESIGLDFTLNVVDISSGKLGFVRTHSEEQVEFIVTSEDNQSYLVENNKFENQYLELPREILEKHNFKGSPKFLVDQIHRIVGVFLEKDCQQGEDSLVIWENGSSSEIKGDYIQWKSGNVALLNLDEFAYFTVTPEGVEV